MKLYEFGPAPNAQRVRVFLAEKRLDIPSVELNVREGTQFAEPYTSMNPFHTVPFLELDDGTVIAESVSICRYLEELHPEPPLFGANPSERALIDMWNRRIEFDGYMPAVNALRNKAPMFAGRVVPGTRNDLPQLPGMVTRGAEMAAIFLDRFDHGLDGHRFIAGDSFSIADITGVFMIRMAKALDLDVDGRCPNVARWFADVSARPSFEL